MNGHSTFGSSAQGSVGCLVTGPFANWIVPSHPNHRQTACLSRSTSFAATGAWPFYGVNMLIEEMVKTSRKAYGTFGGG